MTRARDIADLIFDGTLPSQTGNSGKYLTTNGTNLSWGTIDLSVKANIDSPTFTGTVTLPSSTSIGNVSQTEISYLDGVTSSVQNQLTNGNIISVQLERNTGYTAGVGQLAAYGNGASDGFMIFPFDVDLIYAAMRVTSVHTGTTTVQLNIDGVNQGSVYELSCTGASSSSIKNLTSSPKRITAGQGFNFACTAISGTLGTTVISAFFSKV